jgi:hypothetical protein
MLLVIKEALVWKVLGQILRGTTFYYAQFNFFLMIVFAGSVIWIATSSTTSPKSIPQAAIKLPQFSPNSATPPGTVFDIEVSESGSVKVNGKKDKKVLRFEPDKDRLLFIAVRNSTTFISNLEVTIRLPKPVDDIETLQPRVYAIHGVGHAAYRLIDPQTISFDANSVYDGATVSVELIFPKSYFMLSPINSVRERLASFSPEVWLAIGIVFPAITIFFLFYLVFMQRVATERVKTNQLIAAPPSPLRPAIVGALYRGHIGKKEITSTLFDLALRDFVLIHYSEDDLSFSKGDSLFSQNATTLRPFEIFLLHQIFGDEGFISKQKNVEVGLNSELFSSKIAMTMLNIYDAALAEGFFIQSPNKYYLKYKAAGLGLFFIALAALLYGALTSPAREYSIFLWLGMMVASLLILGIMPGLPRRTPMGDRTLRQWMAFRNYLSLKTPVNAQQSSLYFAYLPYAIVLGCEKEWMARWKDQTLTLPEWFSTNRSLYTAEDYGLSMVWVINFLANHLVAARPPDLV